ncbi:Rv1733c family protein [Streptomyces tagetis]|uniref:Integral membrane protein n=1 Tax=Streptomyces tagetis TaxID=2820809 RepID=A0A940XGP1_9ACTN|nr:hypothetical protein [Streptomyces sp. RG38]MBQ0827107.1 hypothetical protein [Streptomyces sp. RG38]
MCGGEAKRKRLWRWRRNPLRRRVDAVEAWIVLLVWALIAVGGTLAGLLTAHAADASFARQRAERQPVRAVLLADVPQSASPTQTAYRALVKVGWTAPDGTSRTGETPATSGLRAGSSITLWQDRDGSLTGQPADPADASVESALYGAGAAVAVAGLAYGSGALVRWRLDRRRLDEWAREWERVGPRWSQRTG